MTAVWESRWAEAVRRLMALREHTALDLISECMPVLPLLDDSALHLRLLRRERTWEAEGSFAGGATFATLQLNNDRVGFRSVPNTVLCVVEAIQLRHSAAGFVNIFCQRAADNRALAGNFQCVDNRSLPASGFAPKAELQGSTRAALPSAARSIATPVANADVLVTPAGYVLGPGDQLYLQASAAGTTLTVYLRWTERDIDGSEAVPSGA